MRRLTTRATIKSSVSILFPFPGRALSAAPKPFKFYCLRSSQRGLTIKGRSRYQPPLQ